MKKHIVYNDKLPPIRILLLEASDIYYAEKVIGLPLEIKNGRERFDERFNDLMPLNLDLYYLFEKNKLVLKELNDEFYTYCIINVAFEYPLYVKDNGERTYQKNESIKKKAYKDKNDIRKDLYLNGFYLNDKKYVRYKRSASSAREGTCLFIREDLFSMMDNWSKTGLLETYDKKAFEDLTSYEAYRALSLSSLIKTLYLSPYDILFVEDFKHILKDQTFVNVAYDEKNGLTASKKVGEIENNIFDGEGLLDLTIFKKCCLDDKGMMLLRNRFFKCCAFNTNLQAWFKHNGIKSIEQLNGYTCAKRIEDVVLVVSESCLKYCKMVDEGFSLNTIKRWCDAVSNEKQLSRFGIVKTDKETRFFDGDMVETTYQFINTLQLSPSTDCRLLLSDFIDYVNKIRNISETPEYARLFLQGELNESFVDSFDDDSEDTDIDTTEAILDYSRYSFRSKVCFDLIKLNSKFVETDLFKHHMFKDIINSFRLKIYGGRVLVPGTNATILGNPLEYLKYIIKKDNKPLFDKEHLSSTLGKDEICCSFFKDKEELVGARSPHMTMGNLLCVRNKYVPDINKWFNLTRNIVVVDAINNNIQYRLNGMDYDSDFMLLTNKDIIVKVAKQNYDKFLVPVMGFKPDPKPLEVFKEAHSKKENRILNLHAIDCKIANNMVGAIVNLAQKYNSHLWNKLNSNPRFNYEELYNRICILSILAGCEIDSSKRTFPFVTSDEYNKAKKYEKANGYKKKPAFFFLINPDKELAEKINEKQDKKESKKSGKIEKPKVGEINKYVKCLSGKDFLKTSMDYLWQQYALREITAPDTDTTDFETLVGRNIDARGLSGENYNQVKRAKNALHDALNMIYNERTRRKKSSYSIETKNFNTEIAICYDRIKAGINNLKKAKALITTINNEEKTPYSLLFPLLYIISLKQKELGYGYEDLFENDGGVPALERTRKKKTDFVLFNNYYYERSAFSKAIASIRLFEEKK